jgi:hypothetical protein
VVVGFDASGASNTRKPLGKRYSVMPSTLVYAVAFAATTAFGAAARVGIAVAAVNARANARQIGLSFIDLFH